MAAPNGQPSRYDGLLSVAGALGVPEIFDLVLDISKEKGYEMLPTQLVASLSKFGRFQAAAMSARENRTAMLSQLSQQSFDDILEAGDYLSNSGISDKETQERLLLSIHTLMKAYGMVSRSIITEVTKHGLIVGLPVHATEDVRVDYEWKIAEALAESFDDPLAEYLSIVVYPIDLASKIEVIAHIGQA